MTYNTNNFGFCEKCIYWVHEQKETKFQPLGYCYRHPPVPITQTELPEIPENMDRWSREEVDYYMDWKTRSERIFSRPVTGPDDFCGEWREGSV